MRFMRPPAKIVSRAFTVRLYVIFAIPLAITADPLFPALSRQISSSFYWFPPLIALLSAVRRASIGRCTVDARFVEKFLLDVGQRRAVMYAKSRKLVNVCVRSGKATMWVRLQLRS